MKNFNVWFGTFENCWWPTEKTHAYLTRVYFTYLQAIPRFLELFKMGLHHFKDQRSMQKTEIFDILAKNPNDLSHRVTNIDLVVN